MSPITNLLHRSNEYRGVQNETESSSTASTIRRPLVSALKKGSETTKKRKYLQRKVLFVEKSISWPPDGCGTVPVEAGRSGTNLGQTLGQERLVESDPEKMVSAQDYYREQVRNQWHKPSRTTTKVRLSDFDQKSAKMTEIGKSKIQSLIKIGYFLLLMKFFEFQTYLS